MAKGIITGNLSLSLGKKRSLSNAQKAQILAKDEEGRERVFAVTLYTKEGEPVVFKGKVYPSKSTGGLTARIAAHVDFESYLEFPKEHKGEESSAEGSEELLNALL